MGGGRVPSAALALGFWVIHRRRSAAEAKEKQKSRNKWMRDGVGGMAQDRWGLLSHCLPCVWNLAYSAIFHGSGCKRSSVLNLLTLDGLLFDPLFLWLVPSLEPQYSILGIVLARVHHNTDFAVNMEVLRRIWPREEAWERGAKQARDAGILLPLAECLNGLVPPDLGWTVVAGSCLRETVACKHRVAMEEARLPRG